MTELIYCASGNKRFAQIAIEQGFTYGAQLPNTVYFNPDFVDQNWKAPNREKYMQALAQYQPRMATVLDLEHEYQLDEVLSWAKEAQQHVKHVLIIPKVMGIIPKIPIQYRLAYSVPTSYGGTQLPLWEFGDREVHLLGGNPHKQKELSCYLNVVSADSNYVQKLALQYNSFFSVNRIKRAKNYHYPKLNELYDHIEQDAPYLAFRLSCINIQALWIGCRACIRYASLIDIPDVKKIANQYKNELGFVMLPALKKAIQNYELLVAELDQRIVGFVNFHRRKDGISTIYEIATHKDYRNQKIGKALLSAVSSPKQLKCTVENSANTFYEKQGLICKDTLKGKKRDLYLWLDR